MIDAIKLALLSGKREVVDADLSGYDNHYSNERLHEHHGLIRFPLQPK
ncbi:MAG: hypothetical protein ACFUZC_10390 [Chthoniobacteraceae bacterium]